MTPRRRNKTIDWIGFMLLAVMALNAMWQAGYQWGITLFLRHPELVSG